MAYKMLVDGDLVPGVATLGVINPATGEIFDYAARADAELLDRAVAGAKRAFPAWSGRPFAERGALLEAFAAAIESEKDRFARTLTAEQGKPLAEAQIEVMLAFSLLRYFAQLDIQPEVVRQTAAEKIVQHRTPLGVVAAIVPWNFPLLLLALKIGPALIAGNTMIAKPAPTTPLTTLMLGETAAGILPPGVFNTIVDDNDLGPLMSAHPDIAKIAFTGSTQTGKLVMQGAAGTLKRLTLELGGNDAAIVLDDADIKKVAPQVFSAATLNAGQICLAAKRIYAPAALYDALCGELARLAAEAVVDDGAKQGTQIGPVQNAKQFEKMQGYLADARANGNVIAGGHALDRPGYFIAPTVVRDIGDDARLVREEQFGPILPVLSYDTIDEAVARVNDSDFGLGGTIWTSDPARGLDVAMKIDSGIVWVNKHLDAPFDVAFGGAKQSGIGREYGMDGLLEYTQPKVINVAL